MLVNMENITADQLSKYESIINEIEEEFTRTENLKKQLDNEVNKLIAVRVALEENFTKENVFRVLVKLFDSIFDLYYLYSDEIPKAEFEVLKRTSLCKYYLVEVCISNLFQAKIASQKWLLNVCVKNSTMCVNKNLVVSRKQLSNRIYVVIPFDQSIEPSSVTCKLFMSHNKVWSAITISTTKIDISYHFALRENLSKTALSVVSSLPQICYSFKCKCSVRHFYESIVRNCYHRLNSALFSEFSKPDVALNFAIGGNDTQIMLDKDESVLSITSNYEDLHFVKKYLIGEINCQDVYVDKLWFISLLNLKSYLRKELGEGELNVENFCTMHNELQKIVAKLVV